MASTVIDQNNTKTFKGIVLKLYLDLISALVTFNCYLFLSIANEFVISKTFDTRHKSF